MTRIRELRNMQRRMARAFEQVNPSIYNPDVSGLLDKTHVPTSEEKALALGFEASEPKRLLDLPCGDAGSGQTMFRRSHVFYRLEGPGLNAFNSRPAFEPYSNAIGLATQRSSDQKPRYWHVSIYGVGVRRPGQGAVGILPLSESEVASQAFEAIFGTISGDLTTRFVPSVPTCQARVLVHDESGGRYFDVDVIGTRSFAVYAFGVTVFLLIKPIGYEVNPSNDALNEPIVSTVMVEDDIVGARVLPIATNVKQNRDLRTITAVTDVGDGVIFVPIPPGSLKVQIINHDDSVEAALWTIDFIYNRATAGTRVDMGKIDMIPGLARTPVLEIPNVPAISFTAPGGTLPTQWSLIFEVAS